jgi:DNA-binding beta-propeller fold protein YncE
MRMILIAFSLILQLLPILLEAGDLRGYGETFLEIKDTIDLNRLRLGHNFPNILKGIKVNIDEKTGYVYASGILSSAILEIDPKNGRIKRHFDIGLSGFLVNNIEVDPNTRTLYYVLFTGEIIAFDLDTGKRKARYEEREFIPKGRKGRRFGRGGGEARRHKGKIWLDSLVDEEHGLLIMLGRRRHGISIFDDRLKLKNRIDIHGVPVSLAWSEEMKVPLVVIDDRASGISEFCYLDHRKGTINRIFGYRSRSGIGPKRFFVDKKGSVYIGEPYAPKLNAKGTLCWRTKHGERPIDIVSDGEKVAFLYKDGHPKEEEGGIPGCIDFYESESGKFLCSLSVRYEPGSMVLDEQRNRLIVANGGDSSITVIDWDTMETLRTFRLGSSAEHVVYDNRTGNLFIINRLGGSELYSYNISTKRLNAIEVGSWPIWMALSNRRGKLYVLSHYEAKIYVVDPVRLLTIDTIPLGIRGSRTDSLSCMAFHDDSGIIVAGFPETARLVILDVDTNQKVVLRPKGAKPLVERGPANWHVQISQDGKSVYLYRDLERVLTRYNAKGKELASIPVPKITSRMGYVLEIFTRLPSTGELFLGEYPVRESPLSIAQPIPHLERVLDIREGIVYGNAILGRDDEMLVLVERETGKLLSRHFMFRSNVTRSSIYLDIEKGLFFATDMSRAKVYSFNIPNP